MLSRESFTGSGAFVLSTGRTGLVRSTGLSGVSDLSIMTGSTPKLPSAVDDIEDAVLGDLVDERKPFMCTVGLVDDSGMLGRRSKEVRTEAEAGGASLTLRPRK